MAGRIYLYSSAVIELPGQPNVQIGRKGEPFTVSITGSLAEWRGTIANNTTVTLWDATTSAVASWEFFWLLSSGDLLVELQGTATLDNFDMKVRGGFPQYWTLDDTLAYAAAGSFAGSAQVVKAVRARNTSGATVTVDARFIL